MDVFVQQVEYTGLLIRMRKHIVGSNPTSSTILESKSMCKHKRWIDVSAKCNDMCNIDTFDGQELEGYVPYTLNIGGGDYIDFRFCADCGKILENFPLESIDLEEG